MKDLASAPRQADEGAPEAWLVSEPHVADGLRGIHTGSEVGLLTWLDHADRDVLVVLKAVLNEDVAGGNDGVRPTYRALREFLAA